MDLFLTGNTLVGMSQKKKKPLITVEVDYDLKIEFSAAVKILRGRNVSSFLHNFITAQVEKAKSQVSKDEFDKIVAAQKVETKKRSQEKLKSSIKTVSTKDEVKYIDPTKNSKAEKKKSA